MKNTEIYSIDLGKRNKKDPFYTVNSLNDVKEDNSIVYV